MVLGRERFNNSIGRVGSSCVDKTREGLDL